MTKGAPPRPLPLPPEFAVTAADPVAAPRSRYCTRSSLRSGHLPPSDTDEAGRQEQDARWFRDRRRRRLKRVGHVGEVEQPLWTLSGGGRRHTLTEEGDVEHGHVLQQPVKKPV